jgi:hypothetical protein
VVECGGNGRAIEALERTVMLATARMCMIHATYSRAFRTHAHAEILCVCWQTAFNRDSSGGPARRDLILLLYAYPKNVSADLTPRQVAQLAKVVKEEFRDES